MILEQMFHVKHLFSICPCSSRPPSARERGGRGIRPSTAHARGGGAGRRADGARRLARRRALRPGSIRILRAGPQRAGTRTAAPFATVSGQGSEGRLLRCGTPGTSGMPEASGAAGEGKCAFAVRGSLRRSGTARPVAPRALRSGSATCRTQGQGARKGRLAEDAAKARRILRSLEGPYMILFEDHLRREGAFR